MRIVELTSPEDIMTMTQLAARSYDGGFSQFVKVDVAHSFAEYSRMIADGWAVMLALKNDDDIIIGGLGAIVAPDLHSGIKTAIETFWFVIPGSRGGGLRLLSAFEKWGEDKGCSRWAMIHLEDSMPKELESLYKRRGYKKIESHFLKGEGI